MKKRCFAIILAIAMILSGMPIHPILAEEREINYEYIDGCAYRMSVIPGTTKEMGIKNVVCTVSKYDDITYQWYFKPLNQEDATIVSGANSTNYFVDFIDMNQYGSYYCEISAKNDDQDEILTRVYFNVEVDTQFQCETQKEIQVKKSEKADGVTLSLEGAQCGKDCTIQYQWYRGKEISDGGQIVSATENTYTLGESDKYGFYTLQLSVSFGGEELENKTFCYQVASDDEQWKYQLSYSVDTNDIYYSPDLISNCQVRLDVGALPASIQWQGKYYDGGTGEYLYRDLEGYTSPNFVPTVELLAEYTSFRALVMPPPAKQQIPCSYSQDLNYINVMNSPPVQVTTSNEPRAVLFQGYDNLYAKYYVTNHFPEKEVRFQWILQRKAGLQWNNVSLEDSSKSEIYQTGLQPGNYQLECRFSFGENATYISRQSSFSVVDPGAQEEYNILQNQKLWTIENQPVFQGWNYGQAGWSCANQLQVKFSDTTNLDRGVLFIMNQDGTYQNFTEDELAGKTITIKNTKLSMYFYGVNTEQTYTANCKVESVTLGETKQFTVQGLKDQIYTGSPLTQSLSVYRDGEIMKYGTDYTLKYSNNKAVGVASVTVICMGRCLGMSNTFNFAINRIPVTGSKVTLEKVVYNGKKKMPKPTVTCGGRRLVLGQDYIVSYSNNTLPGMGKIIIAGNHHYVGSITKTFIIYPSKVSQKKLKTKKRTVTICWNKLSGVSGYELYKSYSAKSKYRKFKTTSARSFKLTKQKAGKKVYIKIRGYKKINGKKYYGAYSSIRWIKVKK